MEHPILARAIEKFVAAGEKAGFQLEQMIQILNPGVRVETLLDIIERSLRPREKYTGSSRWVM